MGIYGGGNLMLTSQLVVIFSEHLHLAPGLQIALLSVVPLASLPLFVPFWARMFDEGHIVVYRSRQGWSLVFAVVALTFGTWLALGAAAVVRRRAARRRVRRRQPRLESRAQ